MQTPYFTIDAGLLEANLRVLHGIMERTGARVLLAQKCFSCYALYPLIGRYLAGATASGLYEARLCHEEMPGAENHVFSPAYREEDIDELLGICDHIVFNSPRQLALYGPRAKAAGLQVGLRVNPECSTQEGHAIYDPCAPGSRLGTKAEALGSIRNEPQGNSSVLAQSYSLLDGLHFHTLCEQDSDALETTLSAVEEKFGWLLGRVRWINFGGGHHITRPGYDIQRLERCIRRMQTEYGLTVYIEPGEAVALNAGTLTSTVLEVQPQGADGVRNVILDTSAACHMPDVIEMPYTPPLQDVRAKGCKDERIAHADNSHIPAFKYRFGGPTCLSGDVIGEYTLSHELREGDEVVFGDMAIYSMVKTNTFNGMPLPDIYIKEDAGTRLWRRFGYSDFKSRV